MKKSVTIFFAFFLIINVLLPLDYSALAQNSSEDNSTIFLTNAEYSRPMVVNGNNCTYHVAIYSLNFDTQVFTGAFYISGGINYHERITGTCSRSLHWGSGSDYICNLVFTEHYSSNGYFNVDLDDANGMLYGYIRNLGGILGLYESYSGNAHAYNNAIKMRQMAFDNELYEFCRDCAAAAYDDDGNNIPPSWLKY